MVVAARRRSTRTSTPTRRPARRSRPGAHIAKPALDRSRFATRLAVQSAAAPAARSRSVRGPSIHRPLRSNRHVAALLSALWPGLGQLSVGSRRAAFVLALPPLILLALGVAALASPDRLSRLAILLD